MENSDFVDQRARLDRFFAEHKVQLVEHGTIVPSFRWRNQRRLGPYYRLTCRDPQGRQCSVYLGVNSVLVEQVRQRLAELQAPSKQQRHMSKARRIIVRELRRNRVHQDQELRKVGLYRKGAEIRGWRLLKARSIEHGNEASCDYQVKPCFWEIEAMKSDLRQRFELFSGADWRLAAATSLVGMPRRNRPNQIEPLIADLVSYQGLLNQAGNGPVLAAERHPLLAAVMTANETYSDQLKLMVLANVPAGEIAQRLCIDQQIVELWCQIHFDVRHRLENYSWLSIHVLHRAVKEGRPELAARMKVALGGGPQIAEALLGASAKVPVVQAERLFQQKLLLDAKFTEAIELPLETAGEKLRMIQIYGKLQLDSKRLELRHQQFAQQVARDHERRQLQQERLDILRKEADRKAAARQQSEVRRAARQAELAAAVQRELSEQEQTEQRIKASRLLQLTWGPPKTAAPNVERPAVIPFSYNQHAAEALNLRDLQPVEISA